MLKRCAFVLAIAACGGGTKAAPQEPMKPGGGGATTGLSECAVMAAHVAEVVMKFKEPPPTTPDVVAEVVRTRCEADAWSADAKKCFTAMQDEDSAKPCVGTLTNDQHTRVMNEMESHFGHHKHDETGASARHGEDEGASDDAAEGKMGGKPKPAAVQPPARAPAKSAPPPAPKKPSKGDPCEGGE